MSVMSPASYSIPQYKFNDSQKTNVIKIMSQLPGVPQFLNSQDYRGDTVLHTALKANCCDEVIQALVSKGSNLFLTNCYNFMPIDVVDQYENKLYLFSKMNYQIELYGHGKKDYFIKLPQAYSHGAKTKIHGDDDDEIIIEE